MATLRIGQEEYEINENPDKVYLIKKAWVNYQLQALLMTMGLGIKKVSYFCLTNGTEIVRIYFDDEDFCYKDINVSCDSRSGILKDIVNQGALD